MPLPATELSPRMGSRVDIDKAALLDRHRVLPFDRESGREFHRCTLNGEEPVRAAATHAIGSCA